VEPQAISRPLSRHASRSSSPVTSGLTNTSRSTTPLAAVSMLSQLPSTQLRSLSSSSSVSQQHQQQQQQRTTSPVVFSSSGGGAVGLPPSHGFPTPPSHATGPPRHEPPPLPGGQLPPRVPVVDTVLDAAHDAQSSGEEKHHATREARFHYEDPDSSGAITTSSLPVATAPPPTRRFSLYDEDAEEPESKSGCERQSSDKGTSLLQAAYRIMVDAVSNTASTNIKKNKTSGSTQHQPTLQPHQLTGRTQVFSEEEPYQCSHMVPVATSRPRGGSMVSVPSSLTVGERAPHHLASSDAFRSVDTIPSLIAPLSLSSSTVAVVQHHQPLQESMNHRSVSSHSSSVDERLPSSSLTFGMHRMIPTKRHQHPQASSGEANTADRWSAAAQPVRWAPPSPSTAPLPAATHRSSVAEYSDSQQHSAQYPAGPRSHGISHRSSSTTAATADVILWCHKHHTSRNGTGRRCLMLRPTPDGEGVTFTMKKPDGSSWKGPAVPIQSPQALIDGGGGLATAAGPGGEELSNTVLLERSAHISVLTGSDAYNSPSIHQNKVRCAAHCVVVFRKGRLVASLEFDSDRDVGAFLETLACVLS
jgi:hypothetical protein